MEPEPTEPILSRRERRLAMQARLERSKAENNSNASKENNTILKRGTYGSTNSSENQDERSSHHGEKENNSMGQSEDDFRHNSSDDSSHQPHNEAHKRNQRSEITSSNTPDQDVVQQEALNSLEQETAFWVENEKKNEKIDSTPKVSNYADEIEVIELKEDPAIKEEVIKGFLDSVVKDDGKLIKDANSTPSTEEYIQQQKKELKNNPNEKLKWTVHGRWLTKAIVRFSGALMLSLFSVALLIFVFVPGLIHMFTAAMNFGFTTNFSDVLMVQFWDGGLPVLFGPAWLSITMTLAIIALILSALYFLCAREIKIGKLRLRTYGELRAESLGKLTENAREAYNTNVEELKEWGDQVKNEYDYFAISEESINDQFNEDDIITELRKKRAAKEGVTYEEHIEEEEVYSYERVRHSDMASALADLDIETEQ